MKKVFFSVALFSISICATAQVGNILKKAKEKLEKPSAKTDKKTEDKKDTKAEETKPATENKPADTTIKDANAAPATIKAYSKYDFVPGEKVIGFEDFSTGNIGDFPAGWNTSSSAEIVTIEGKPGRWLWLTKPGVFIPEFTTKFPDDFTFEFDLLHGIPINGAQFAIIFAELSKLDEPQHWRMSPNVIELQVNTASTGSQTGGTRYNLRKNSESSFGGNAGSEILNDAHNPIHVSIWRQKERLRLYVNEEKIWDIPKALAKESKLNAVLFDVLYAEKVVQHYIGNLRLAVGAPDTRNKFITEGKWVTHGILFDVNSATIKPESYGSMKEIANILKENPDVKVKIVGHTDSDGADAANLDLSKRRAASVKATLAKEFGIDESRMETDGMGESKPIDKNDTPAGKANNRRVEFIKM
jgi:outer membrane protein OmpA-like peptidoglycan-associated protein